MGVPKFFRYMSERYPCLSEFVKEYQIPVFDNLYLDMNGIIHMCSHPDDNNPHFRITEEKLFSDIFHYIEVLFRMIKPQKVFFMAIDGVAPRAKMNQQRGRRFRSAKDAEKSEKDAIKKGEKLPDAARFDSNCITPGTEFMAKLHEQLKYFVVNKVSTDKMWKTCTVILSGHETPGEGEHKIMDYIRYVKSKPGYDPNTRHCLYGLDADLIMLGLCTHEPHFSLLREEVKFGRKSTKRANVPEEIRFYLLHLSLMREYLELEFACLKDKLKATSFQFDIEKIIDDWILMGFLVGNDFIPNLPNLHITNGALPILYNAYMEILPTLDGYINEAGTLNLGRFDKFMRKLADIDLKSFEEVRDDMLFFKKKTGRKLAYHSAAKAKLDKYEDETIEEGACKDVEEKTSNLDPALAALIQETDELDITSEEEDDESSSDEDFQFKQFKDEYYRNKLQFRKVTRQVLQDQAEGYVRAIQWNLNYYYNGVCSWSWYYPHHYSPYISDIKGFSNLKIGFELGKPFQPYEQLLAVLPAASKGLLPTSYHKLMTDEDSLIKEYYPQEFDTDLNGKKQEWEAVVLVPFIDENVLLEAMKPCNQQLAPEEVKRNTHGPMLLYNYVEDDLEPYEAPAYFPIVSPNRAHCTPIYISEIRVPQEELIKGPYPGAKFDVFYPGFPTMKHLKYTSEIKKAKVKVFEQCSRNENMILKVSQSETYCGDKMPVDLLGKTIWVAWPHLVEAKVVAVSNNKTKFVYDDETMTNKVEDKSDKLFLSEVEGVTDHYFNRMGIDFGKTDMLVHVKTMTGRKYVFTQSGRVNLEKQFASGISNYPVQSVVSDIKAHDELHTTYREITDIFPVGSSCFALTIPYYGCMGTVLDSTETLKTGQLKVSLTVVEQPNLKEAWSYECTHKDNYYALSTAASPLSLSNNVFSRITGSLFVDMRTENGESKSTNIGLDLKFNKKNQETPGYTKKINNYWYYSQKTTDIVGEYNNRYPEVFVCLSRKQYSNSGISATEIFGDDGDEKVKTVQSWIKTLPTHNLERRSCNSHVLEPETVKTIEEILDEHEAKNPPKTITLNYKPYHLYKYELQTGNLVPDAKATHQVFDRIVNVRDGYSVPFGLKGNIIAKYEPEDGDGSDELFDIVFDRTFAGGMTLNCSEQRGYRLSKTSFINISHGKREMEEKTGRPGELRAKAKERQNVNSFQLNPDASFPNMMKDANSAFAPFNKIPVPQAPRAQLVHNKLNAKNQFHYMADFGQNFQIRNNKENKVNKPTQSNLGATCAKKSLPKPSFEEKVKPEVVDTEFLKKVLKIDSKPSSINTTSTSRLPQQSGPPNSSAPNTASATARLLSYYQMNSLGCPRYTYFQTQNKFSAQVVLPNQTVITGKEANSREEASENVATQALTLIELISRPSGHTQQGPHRFPVPPSNWMRQNDPQNKQNAQVFTNRFYQPRPFPNNQRNGPVHENFNNKLQKSTIDNRKPNKQNYNFGNSSANASFVPLQVTKKRQTHTNDNTQGSYSGATSAPVKTGNDRKFDKESNSTKTQTKEIKHGEKRTGHPQKSSRKTRIAANFIPKN